MRLAPLAALARSPHTRAAVSCAVICLGLTGCGLFDAGPSQPSVEETKRKGRGKARSKKKKKAAGDPLGRSPSNAAAMPSPAEIARMAPTPLDQAAPADPPVEAPETPPHVVLVLGCTLRKDQLGPYGAPDHITPHLNQLAAEGAVFDDTLAAAPWTRAASTGLLTGRHPVHMGMVEPANRRNDRVLPADVLTVAELADRAGYITVGATANPNLMSNFGFDQGFDAYQRGLDNTNWARKASADDILDATLRALDQQRADAPDAPVYLQVMLLDAHDPRNAPATDYAPYGEDGLPDRIAQYRFHTHAFDAGVGRLRSELGERGLTSDNTVFVVVGDHGEGMNYPRTHGYAHGQYPAPSVVHVPWLMQGPGVATAHRVLGTSSGVDLLPTLADTVGWPLSEEERAQLDGQSHVQAVRGEAGTVERDHAIVDTWFQEANRAALFTASHQCQQEFGSSARQQAKGLFVPGCYDRHADPALLSPLPAEHAASDRIDELIAWRTQAEQRFAAASVTESAVDEALSEQLEALGYRE